MHKAKKSLGQNFLKSEIALLKIIEAGEIKKSDVILEIGPVMGALTEKLLEKAGTVIAVEKDYSLVSLLKEKFAEQISAGSLVLVHDDILNFEVARQNLATSLERYKIIANIPYNITGAILKKFLTGERQPEIMVLMVQHEVATRILARDCKESILSISVKAYGEPKMIAKVDKRYFSPAPKVNSAIIVIKNISRKLFISPLPAQAGQPSPYKGEGDKTTVQDKTWNSQAFEEKFWEIVKAGFAHKRKKLSSNLKTFLKNSEDGGISSVESLGNRRAEDLSLPDWILLSKQVIINL